MLKSVFPKLANYFLKVLKLITSVFQCKIKQVFNLLNDLFRNDSNKSRNRFTGR